MTDDNALIAQTAAVLATMNYYECVNPEELEITIDSMDCSTISRFACPSGYNVKGSRIKTYQHGINIVKFQNGKIIKIIK